MLECQTASLAAVKATESNVAELEENLTAMEASIDDPEAYLEADLRFHLVLAQATQNSILFNLISLIRGYLQAWIKEALRSSPDHDRVSRARLSVIEHREVLEAIRNRDAESALAAMRKHILSSSAGLQAQRAE
jgi:GntR family transcriptional repressor for pyruvate dehydrogenase complex